MASLWSTRQSKYATEYGKNYGKKISTLNCLTNCSTSSLLYAAILDLPTPGMPSSAKKCSYSVDLIGMGIPFVTKPFPKESVTTWASYELEMDLHGFPKQFADLDVPVALSAFSVRKGAHGNALIIDKGDLHIANMAGSSPAHIAYPVLLGPPGHQVRAGDGYPGDPFGVLGWDQMFSDKTISARRILNIVPVDSKKQAMGEANWTSLKNYKALDETVSIFMSFDNFFLYSMAFKNSENNLPSMKSRDYVWAIHKGTEDNLDKPMMKSSSESDPKKHYNQFVSLLPLLGLKSDKLVLEKNIGKALADRGGMWYKAVLEDIEPLEAVDSEHLLENKGLVSMKKCFGKVFNQLVTKAAKTNVETSTM